MISYTTCDRCNKKMLSDIAMMDPDNREVLCAVCFEIEYPSEYKKMVREGLEKIQSFYKVMS